MCGGFVSAIFGGGNSAPPPLQLPVAPPPPQAAKAPDAQSVKQDAAGQGQAGGAPGVAQTFLTAAGGVDPNTLQLGKNTLLGS